MLSNVLKNGKSQPKRAYKARAYKKKRVCYKMFGRSIVFYLFYHIKIPPYTNFHALCRICSPNLPIPRTISLLIHPHLFLPPSLTPLTSSLPSPFPPLHPSPFPLLSPFTPLSFPPLPPTLLSLFLFFSFSPLPSLLLRFPF